MSACNFIIPFSDSSEAILQKAKSSVEGQGGSFTGDVNAGNFNLSIFGNAIIGSYTVQEQNLNIVIDEKPFLVPCSAIESFLKKQLG